MWKLFLLFETAVLSPMSNGTEARLETLESRGSRCLHSNRLDPSLARPLYAPEQTR